MRIFCFYFIRYRGYCSSTILRFRKNDRINKFIDERKKINLRKILKF